MGDWAKQDIGRAKLPKRCFLFAGTTPEIIKEQILSNFEEIQIHRHDVYERYIVTDGGKEYLILFQVYGASTITDITYILNDGGVEEVIFIGATFGIHEDLRIGDIVIPNKVQALEGILKMNLDVDYSYPNENFQEKIKNILDENREEFFEGKTVSVPSTFLHPDNSKRDNDVIALEMEFSSACYFTNKFNIKCAGILVVSDTENHDLLDKQNLRYKKIIKAFNLIKSEVN